MVLVGFMDQDELKESLYKASESWAKNFWDALVLIGKMGTVHLFKQKVLLVTEKQK